VSEEKKWHLKHRDSLLSQLAEQLRQHERSSLGSIEVVLFVAQTKGADVEYAFGLTRFIDVLANDVYWDVNGNWEEAYRLEVRTM